MKSSKKILGASAALGLAVALAAGSTFAWFSLGKTDVAVDPFTLTVASGDGALTVGVNANSANMNASDCTSTSAKLTDTITSVKLEPQTLGSSLTEDGSAISGAAAFTAVSGESAGKVDFYLGFYYQGTLEDGQTAKIVLDSESKVEEVGTAPAAEIDLTQYDSYYIPTNNSGDVVNDSNGDWGSLDVLTQEGFFGDTVTGTKAPAPRAANAARVMFTQTSNGSDTTHKVWSPNEALATGGQVTATAYPFTATAGNAKGYWKNNFAGCLYNISEKLYETDEDGDSTLNYGDLIEQKAYTSNVTADGTTSILELAATSQGTGYLGVMHVQIWLEGTDGDCWDSVQDDQMSVTLKFSVVVE